MGDEPLGQDCTLSCCFHCVEGVFMSRWRRSYTQPLLWDVSCFDSLLQKSWNGLSFPTSYERKPRLFYLPTLLLLCKQFTFTLEKKEPLTTLFPSTETLPVCGGLILLVWSWRRCHPPLWCRSGQHYSVGQTHNDSVYSLNGLSGSHGQPEAFASLKTCQVILY